MRHFVDRCKIWIQAGDGGDGCSSFRREKFVPRGGPDGGDGGKGGNVIITALEGLYTVWQHCLSPHKIAMRGKHGSGKKCHGANGKDLVVYVPVGTQVMTSDQNQVLVDLIKSGQTTVLAKGGKGGKGNTRFKSATVRAPRMCTRGSPGERFWAWLQVKLLVDVGLVGLPNCGKSSLLRRLTRATPKVANYSFTTLDPQLGILENFSDGRILIADIPGLVSGACQGKGLGRYFLRHVERCHLLLQVIDIDSDSLKNDYSIIRQELGRYQKALSKRRYVIVLNKIDLLSNAIQKRKLMELQNWCKVPVIMISALTGENIHLLQQLIVDNFIHANKLSNVKEVDEKSTKIDTDKTDDKIDADYDELWSPW